MHKIKKGIKKKIKGKKDKDAELFTPEEYEKYRKQKEEELKQKDQEHHQQEGTTDDHPEELPSENHQEVAVEEQQQVDEDCAETSEKKEDWRNFLSATDTVLKKTTVNLEHIKESSYFQAVKKHEETEVKAGPAVSTVPPPVPAPPTKRWADLSKGIDDSIEGEEGEEGEREEENHLEENEEREKVSKPFKDIVLKPIEDIPIVAEEDYADVFDTTYVDAVEGGEVQLYEIPDSPTLEDSNEPDPFDTSNAEKVLHIEKEEPQQQQKLIAPEKPQKKKKNLVNLGCAVDVLTGKSVAKKKSEEVDLLLADFGDEKETQEGTEVKEEEEEKKKEEKEKGEVKESVEKKEEEEEKCALDDLLFGGETDGNLLDVVVPPSLLLSSSTEKEASDHKEEKENNIDEGLVELLDPLISSESVTVDNKESHLKDLVAEFDVIDEGKVIPAVPVIPEILRKSLSLAVDDNIHDEFDAEFAVLAAESVAKEKEKAIDEIGLLEDDDPFDTSSVVKVLGEVDNSDTSAADKVEEKEVDPFNVDFAKDFIKEESKPRKPERPAAPAKTALLSAFADEDPFDTSAADKFLPSDPFEAVEDSLSLPDILKPQLGSEIPQLNSASDPQDTEFDPFDTSAADSFGKTELRVLEGELLSDLSQVSQEPDFDFNPREEEKTCKYAPPVRPPSPACLLTTDEDNSETPVLAPFTLKEDSVDFDPFDTSIAEKVHIKNLEEELLSDIQTSTSLTVSHNSIKNNPPPRPASPSCLISSLNSESDSFSKISSIAKKALAEDFDPFDTSIADQFEPLDTKAGEEHPSVNLALNLKPPRPASPVCLLATTPTDANSTLDPILQPTQNIVEEPKQEEFDPFDTSIAEQFGKTELKVLETELLSEAYKELNEEEEDKQFDPRAKQPKLSRPPPPRPLSPACLLTSTADEIDQNLPPLSPLTAAKVNQKEEEIDPFDTSIADKFGKTEIFNLESEFLNDLTGTSDSNTFKKPNHSVVPPQRPPIPSHCVFATTPTDNNPSLQPFSEEIQPKEGSTFEEIDPFDTSIADQFGKTELKALEETLLSQNPVTKEITQTLNVVEKDHLFDISPSADCLPVLQPSTNIKTTVKSDLTYVEYDPFDTSIAATFGQVELKVLESELLVDSGVKRNLSDDEFDPREEENCSKRLTSSNVTSSINILDCDIACSESAAPVLKANTLPEVVAEPELEIDPFDTSIAENIVPGQQELKLLDQELLGTK